MSRNLGKRLALLGAVGAFALAFSAAPVQLGSLDSPLGLKAAQADNNNSNNSNNPSTTSTGGGGGGGGNPGSSGPGASGPGVGDGNGN